MTSSADREFDDIAGRVLNATWKFYPDRASKQGLHDYDGGMTDISPSSIAGVCETWKRTSFNCTVWKRVSCPTTVISTDGF